MTKRKRRKFSAQEKVSILRLHLLEGTPVSEVCASQEISPTLFYQWQKTLFEEGAAAFDRARRRPDPKDREIGQLKEQLTRKVAVIGELAQELVEAKKPLGGS